MSIKLSRGDLVNWEKSKREDKMLSKPVKMPTLSSPISKWINQLLLPFIMSPISNQLVADFQEVCGIQADGTVTNLPLKYFFKLCSTAGEEIFGLMPLLIYSSVEISYSFATNFGIMLTIGQMTKDLLFLPRPPKTWSTATRPIVKLEKHHETEFGFPSTHAMSGLLPLSCFLALARRGVAIRDEWWMYCAVYSGCVALSRLYMGVHSLLDVVGGTIYGLVIIYVLHVFGDSFDDVTYKSPYGIIVTILGFFLFILFYPRTKPWSASFGTAAQFFGTWLGLAFSFWFVNVIRPDLGKILESVSLLTSENLTDGFSDYALRFMVGMVIVGFNKVFVKWWANKVFLNLRKLRLLPIAGDEEIDVYGHKVPDLKTYWVEIPVRLLNYSSLVFGAVVVTPLAWHWLGLVGK